ncbi:hypothetical protein SAMN05421813_10931 [Daejeonella rubra]|uniref:DUF6799 domain-containing protein n=1 Tax=Daejeonella rubra TaxID=990371 RepID=A0A1G9S1E5_9SPHI|nr:DUF6799 domain-containing protein [Daejeonella rubra]SDM29303.1 hypothetical protein SAMN05421813_10931 [Daejeonella rubra]
MKTKISILLIILLGAGSMLKAQQQDQIQKQDRIHQEEHLRFYDGKLYQYKDGVQSQVTEQVRLRNGTVVNPDGSYQLQNQERFQLRQGECLDMDGIRYRTQNKFNKRRSIPDKQISPNRSGGINRNKPAGSRGGGAGAKRGKNN